MNAIGQAMGVVAMQQWMEFDDIGQVLAAGRSTSTGTLETRRIQILMSHQQLLEERAREVRQRAARLTAKADFLEQRLPMMNAVLENHG